MASMIQAILEALGNYRYLALYGLCLLAGFFLLKGRRKLFLVPCALLSAAILNPLFYEKWNELNSYAYWRTLWMLPVLPVCAAIPAWAVERAKSRWVRLLSVAAALGVFALCGSYLYAYPLTAFTPSDNAAKLPEDVVKVGDALLALDEEPYVVTDIDLSIYLRQYSGRIRSLYARDVIYGAPSGVAKHVYAHLSSPNGSLYTVAQNMLDEGYEYLVTANQAEGRAQALEEAGFEFIEQVGGYGVYRVTGHPTEVRTYNALRQVMSRTTVDIEGNPINASGGYATTEYDYDENGYVTYEFHRDVNGDGVTDKHGVAGYRRAYNRFGVVTSETNLGPEGTPVVYGGYATRKREYVMQSKLSYEAYFDEEGRPMLQTDTLYAAKRVQRDAKGNATGEAYFGVDGESVLCASGYASFRYELDGEGRWIRQTYYDTQGKPVRVPDGYAGRTRAYDAAGNVSSEGYLDVDGQSMCGPAGYAERRRVYNEAGQIVREEYYGTDGNPIAVSGGYAAVVRDYDIWGDITAETYLDAAGAPMLQEQGYVTLIREYDVFQRLAREAYLNAAGNAVVIAKGYAAFTREYDAAGNVTVERYYDAAGQPVELEKGYAEVRRSYDAKKRLTREAYVDRNGNSATVPDGYSSFTREYDDAGNTIGEAYFDASGRPVACKKGYARFARVYDKRKHILSEAYFGPDDNPAALKDGYAAYEREYDDAGNIVLERYSDGYGHPVLRAQGYAEVRRAFGEGKRQLEESYWDAAGEPVNCEKGYAHWYAEYDGEGRLSLERFVDAAGQPASVGIGYASIEYAYTEAGELSLVRYLDGAGASLPAGSAYFHEFLTDLVGRNVAIFISAKDEAAKAITPTLVADMRALGIQTDLTGRNRQSFYAVVTPEGVQEDVGDEALTASGTVAGLDYAILSAGHDAGSRSSILIDGIEYSPNTRGLNIAILDLSTQTVLDALCFDTHAQEMTVGGRD